MGCSVLPAADAHRRRSNPMGVLNTDLEGTGRVRLGDEVLTLDPLSALHVGTRTLRRVTGDTGADALWLVCGAPAEPGNTLEVTPEKLADLRPDGPRALPPEPEA